MKGIIAAIAAGALFVLSGCETASYLTYNFERDKEMSASVGGEMCGWKVIEESDAAGASTVTTVLRESLLYYGVSDSTVRISYRQWASGRLVSGSSADIRYNIARDSVIAFQSTVIKILDADNREIRFVILDSPSFQLPHL